MMKYEEKLLKVALAIQEARKISLDPNLVKLYIQKADGLNDFDPIQIYDILYKLEQQEKILTIKNVPSYIDPYGHDEIDTFLSGETCFAITLLDNFDTWLNKFHPVGRTFYSFNTDSGILTIGECKIKFTDGKRRIPFLELLVKNNKARPNEYIYHGEAAEVVEGASRTKDPKNTFYELCRGIEARLIRKGITDFLEYDFNRARINPLYQKTSK